MKEEIITFTYKGDSNKPPPVAPRLINGCDFYDNFPRAPPTYGFHDFGTKRIYTFTVMGDRIVVKDVHQLC